MYKLEIIIRSCLCNILFFSTLAIMVIFSMVLLPFPQQVMSRYWRILSMTLNLISKYVAGIDANVIGRHKGGACIYAARHESLWETMFLVTILENPIFVLKQELIDIPVFGTFLKKLGSISVDRKNGASALIGMAKQVNNAIKCGHSVIIFPEGTRRSPDADVQIKRGIVMLYRTAKCAVIPIALNSGHLWPKRGFIKYPGTITVQFLDPIEPGLDSETFTMRLQEELGEAVKELHKSELSRNRRT